MGRFFSSFFVMAFFALLVFGFSSPVAAAAQDQSFASPTHLTLTIELWDDKTFWNYSFLTKDGKAAKPATIQVIWDAGDPSKQATIPVVFPAGQYKSDVVLTTEKKAMVNIRVSVRDANNVELGSLSLQIKNHGQTESFTIAPPDFTEPKITYGG